MCMLSSFRARTDYRWFHCTALTHDTLALHHMAARRPATTELSFFWNLSKISSRDWSPWGLTCSFIWAGLRMHSEVRHTVTLFMPVTWWSSLNGVLAFVVASGDTDKTLYPVIGSLTLTTSLLFSSCTAACSRSCNLFQWVLVSWVCYQYLMDVPSSLVYQHVLCICTLGLDLPSW